MTKYKPRYYLLDKSNHIVETDLFTWAEFFEGIENRRVAHTKISDKVHVSTVFLGLDHGFGQGPPIVFETLVFGGPLDGDMWRYSSYDDAVTGHKMAVKKAQSHEEQDSPRG